MKSIILLSLFLLTACASKEENQKKYCNMEGAYDKGYADGKRNLDLTNDALSFCPSNRARLMMEYREGYYKGQDVYAREPRVPTSALGSSPNTSLPRKCLLEFRGDTFLGEGYSYGDAIKNAQSKCATVYGKDMCPMNCETLPDK